MSLSLSKVLIWPSHVSVDMLTIFKYGYSNISCVPKKNNLHERYEHRIFYIVPQQCLLECSYLCTTIDFSENRERSNSFYVFCFLRLLHSNMPCKTRPLTHTFTLLRHFWLRYNSPRMIFFFYLPFAVMCKRTNWASLCLHWEKGGENSLKMWVIDKGNSCTHYCGQTWVSILLDFDVHRALEESGALWGKFSGNWKTCTDLTISLCKMALLILKATVPHCSCTESV